MRTNTLIHVHESNLLNYVVLNYKNNDFFVHRYVYIRTKNQIQHYNNCYGIFSKIIIFANDPERNQCRVFINYIGQKIFLNHSELKMTRTLHFVGEAY